jgi:ADP-heptose:LPS heptosyltransferase
MKILIYCNSPYIGDNMRLFNLINSLNSGIKNCELWYLGSSDYDLFSGALKSYNLVIRRAPQSLLPKRSLWDNIVKKIDTVPPAPFDLVINLGSNFYETMQIRQIPTKCFFSSTWGFLFCSRYGNYQKHKVDPTIIVGNIEKMLDISIPVKPYSIDSIDQALYQEAKRLLPNKHYIGFAVTQGHPTRKKSWSIDKFINIANEVVFRGYTPVFIIEKSYQKIIDHIQKEVPDAVFPELKTDMGCPALVTTMAQRLEAAVSIDCGVMHMIGLAKIPMVVLFGPTDPKKFAPRVESIKILDSKVICDSTDANDIPQDVVLNALEELRINQPNDQVETAS